MGSVAYVSIQSQDSTSTQHVVLRPNISFKKKKTQNTSTPPFLKCRITKKVTRPETHMDTRPADFNITHSMPSSDKRKRMLPVCLEKRAQSCILFTNTCSLMSLAYEIYTVFPQGAFPRCSHRMQWPMAARVCRCSFTYQTCCHWSLYAGKAPSVAVSTQH